MYTKAIIQDNLGTPIAVIQRDEQTKRWSLFSCDSEKNEFGHLPTILRFGFNRIREVPDGLQLVSYRVDEKTEEVIFVDWTNFKKVGENVYREIYSTGRLPKKLEGTLDIDTRGDY